MTFSRRAAIVGGVLGGAAVAAATVAGTRPAAALPDEGTALNPDVAREAGHVRRLRTMLNSAAAGSGRFDRDSAGRAVVVAEPKQYVLQRPLVIGGNTTLRATGATFVADIPVVAATYTKDKNQHSDYPPYDATFTSVAAADGGWATLLINHVPAAATAYTGSGKIRIEGGTWDPTAYFLRDVEPGVEFDRATAAPPMNAITFQHARDIEISGVTVRNVKWWHGIELNAVQNATVSECRLEGWVEAPTAGLWHGEAVQLDLPTPANTWAGAADGTPCTDIRIRHNYCGRSEQNPGWGKITGSHTGAADSVHTGVWIENNLIEDAKWDAIGPMNTQQVVIRENVIKNSWGGVYVKAIEPNGNETVDIVGNDITLTDGSNRPAVGVNATNANTPVSDVAVYGNEAHGGTFSYSANVTFRREPQR